MPGQPGRDDDPAVNTQLPADHLGDSHPDSDALSESDSPGALPETDSFGASAHLPETETAGHRLAAFASSRGRYYAIILAVFAAVLIISNISATKVIGFGPIVTDGGAFLFPIAYILGDVISEVYGFKAARKAVITGFALQILATLVFWLVLISPPGPGYENQEAFAAVLGFYPRIVAASLVGYVVGQLLNSYVLVAVKKRMGEQKLWVRLLTSTGVGEFADTLIFCTIAFAGVIPGMSFVNYVIVGFVYKVAVEIILLPVTYRVITVVKRHEPSYEAQPSA